MMPRRLSFREFVACFWICAGSMLMGDVDWAYPIHNPSPRIPRSMESQDAVVTVEVALNPDGYVVDASVMESTNPVFDPHVLEAIRQWRYRVPDSGGREGSLVLTQTFRFNGGLFSTDGDRSDAGEPARVIHREPLDVPESLSRVSGRVDLEVRVDPAGLVEEVRVIASTHRELDAVAVACVRKWRYAPALEGGRPVASTVQFPMRFGLDRAMRSVPDDERPVLTDRDVVLVRSLAPDVPVGLRDRSAHAEVDIYVDRFGFVEYAETVQTSDPLFAIALVDAVYSWKWVPVEKDGSPLAVKVRQSVRYEGGMLVMGGTAKDRYPAVRKKVNPKVPSHLRGVHGEVALLVTIGPDGKVRDALAREATHPELADACVDAVTRWRFDPALESNRKVSCQVIIPFEFR